MRFGWSENKYIWKRISVDEPSDRESALKIRIRAAESWKYRCNWPWIFGSLALCQSRVGLKRRTLIYADRKVRFCHSKELRASKGKKLLNYMTKACSLVPWKTKSLKDEFLFDLLHDLLSPRCKLIESVVFQSRSRNWSVYPLVFKNRSDQVFTRSKCLRRRSPNCC